MKAYADFGLEYGRRGIDRRKTDESDLVVYEPHRTAYPSYIIFKVIKDVNR